MCEAHDYEDEKLIKRIRKQIKKKPTTRPIDVDIHHGFESNDGPVGHLCPHGSVLGCSGDALRSPCSHRFSGNNGLHLHDKLEKAASMKEPFNPGCFIEKMT